jgi:HEAT repeat protein
MRRALIAHTCCAALFASATFSVGVFTPAAARAADKPAEPQLSDYIKDLEQGDLVARVRAADRIGDRGAAAKEAVGALTLALKHDDEQVRWHAARALGAIGPGAAPAIEALSAGLKDPGALTRAYSAFALGRIGKSSASALPLLAAAVNDPDASVRRLATKAIRAINPDPTVIIPLFVEVLKTAEPATLIPTLDAMANLGEPAVPVLIETLKDGKSRYWACVVLSEIGTKAQAAVPALTDALKDSQAYVRREALLCLGHIGPAARPATDAIIGLLNNDDQPTVRAAAAFALAKIGPDAGDSAKTALRNAVAGKDEFVHTVSLWALTRIDPKNEELRSQAVTSLVKTLKHENPRLRSAAANALADLNSTASPVLPAFVAALQDQEAAVRAIASEALVHIGEPAIEPLCQALDSRQSRGEAALILGRLGSKAKSAVGPLTAALDDSSPDVRGEVLFALAEMGPDAKSAVPGIAKLLKEDSHESVRHSAAYTLGKIGPDAKAATAALLDTLDDDSESLDVMCAWALSKIDPANSEAAAASLSALIGGLDDEQEAVRVEAADALGAFGPAANQAVPALTDALDDESELVRSAAAAALKKIQR